jgi:deoxyribodipyrimidine photo-lyase
MSAVPHIRVFQVNDRPIRPEGQYVLYWMTSNRRLRDNFALDRAIEQCRKLDKPLLILEALRCGYQWASDRIHTFIVQGMADNAREAKKRGITLISYLEPTAGAGKGLLKTLAAEACAVVGDYFPCFMLPHMTQAASHQVDVAMELVDSNGVLPVSSGQKAFPTAYAFRRFLQHNLLAHLQAFPEPDPLKSSEGLEGAKVPQSVVAKWHFASEDELAKPAGLVSRLPIDHSIGAGALTGGPEAGLKALKVFLEKGLSIYNEQRNQPFSGATSNMSPYLHFGHVAAHTVFKCIAVREKWSSAKLSSKVDGKRVGWWGMSAASEAFLDQLITWRELGYNAARFLPSFDKYESLPEWARESLAKHSSDPRKYIYSRDQLSAAETHDQVWNAAQRELVRTGQMHNYLRMLWGKKVLEWSRTPEEALETLIDLNNRYALDGRNPNSYSGIFWCFGRYDRPWGPERQIFGVIRYMSSDNTVKKLDLDAYLKMFK